VIGGEDLVLDGPTSPDDWTVIFHELRRRWPDAIFHKVGDDEWFAYRDQDAFRRGFAPDETPHGFVHVLMSADCLTFVVDDDETTEASQVGRTVFAAMRALRENALG
jgi:hypothetical protein